ncbi:MAG: DHH family phosphoesterase [Bacteroidales bacterium]|nr:DHH family phosphoesterase [Bacteroidales bacterium]
METAEKIRVLSSLIDASSRIVISTHIHPDGDALGSSGAVFHYLREVCGKSGVAVVREAAPQTIAFIDGRLKPAAPEAISAADLIICTDYNGLSRSGAQSESLLRSSKAPKVLIDHHLNPQESEFDLVFSRTEVSSASEMVYEILRAMPGIDGRTSRLPMSVLNCLMAGMTTDTNNFANSVFPSTLEMAADLIASGVDRDAIVAELYNRYRPNRVRAIAHILSEHLTIRPDGLAVIIVTRDLWHRFSLQEGELEGMVNIPLTIDEVKVCLYLRESEDEPEMRASIRSKKGWSANAMAARYFHGGGHEQAAGGKLLIPGDIPDASAAAAFTDKIEI